MPRGLLVMMANSALQVSQAPWVRKAMPVPTDLRALWARPGKTATMALPAVPVVEDSLDTLDLKALKDRKAHLGQTALFVALQAHPVLLLNMKSMRPPLQRLHLHHLQAQLRDRKNQKRLQKNHLKVLPHPKHPPKQVRRRSPNDKSVTGVGMSCCGRNLPGNALAVLRDVSVAVNMHV